MRPVDSPNRKIIFISIISISLLIIILTVVNLFSGSGNPDISNLIVTRENCISDEFEKIKSTKDVDSDGIDDTTDFYQSALKRTQIKETYLDKYYSTNGGKPPEDEGVCTDVIWRAFEGAGYDFQEMLDTDIKNNPEPYPLESWNGQRDKLIDFRRVPNIEVYLQKYANKQTTELIGCYKENLSQWQSGDIVIFSLDGIGPSDHIAIISERRNEKGIPYLIHNWGRGTSEDLKYWGEIKGHYRLNFDQINK